MAVTPVVLPFCLAVSDGVGSSNYSQYCSTAVVKAIKNLWQSSASNNQIITSNHIHDFISQTKHSSKRHGAAATLAMIVVTPSNDKTFSIRVTRMGDSRVYYLSKDTAQWQCLTRDHSLLNELVDQQAREQGRQAEFADYNREGMAGSLYSITECFALTTKEHFSSGESPNSSVRTIEVQSGDCLMVCTDGIPDLVPSEEWQTVNDETNLQAWSKMLKDQVYVSEGNAYDNGTAIVVRFE